MGKTPTLVPTSKKGMWTAGAGQYIENPGDSKQTII